MDRMHDAAWNRRRFSQTLLALGAGGLAGTARAVDGYPKKPIRLIVPLPAGGSADLSARVLAQQLESQMKQSVLVDNKPGGSFVIGMQAITSAPADGYTMISINRGTVAAQVTLKKLDLLKSLIPVSLTGTVPCQLVVPAKSPFRTPAELVEYGRKNPGKLNYGSVGVGGLEHLWTTLFCQKMGFEATHVPFKGMPDAITALVQGELHFIPSVYTISAPYVQKGMLRSLAVLSDQRLSMAPEQPTLKEQGIDVRPMEFWGGICVAAGTPREIVDQLRSEIVRAVAEPVVKEKLLAQGSTAGSSDTETFTNAIRSDIQWMNEVIKAGKMTFD